MATRYLRTDRNALGFVAVLVDDFYTATHWKDRRELAAEIRQQTARFGLSNWDRNRMNWTVAERVDNRPAQSSQSSETSDPRKVLKAVK